MSEERMRILKMLEKGEITAEEATELLNALESKPVATKKTKKKIRILVSENGQEKVNITIPLKLAKVIANFVPKSAISSMEEEGIDIHGLIDSIDEEMGDEPLVNINDGGDRVVITIE
ncbi:SHOCT-like domain-containing protein [Natronospora cellulosivora (SeqCode)]